MTLKNISRRWRVVLVVIGIAIIYAAYIAIRPYDVVAVSIGGSYEKARLGNTLSPSEPGHYWGGFVTRPSVLRFVDSQYGFITPAAKFLSVSYDENGSVATVRISPQVKILSLDKALTIVFDLQDQFRKGGWLPFNVDTDPPFEKTEKMRSAIGQCSDPSSYWQAGDKYQILLNIRCFWIDEKPNEVRYLITFSISDLVYENNDF
ncbi:flagellar biosynthesis sigma factor [Glaciimonas sp. PAMC28666]|uniref:flagellar biosynthesis sigma factor n=1 Tax=Glaciimonas sp. PAMC28666 TaxID=2807626 RepID=UPI00196505DE|nr:flagellar biosynthesis sigma factor [Glaciimonas sp. PAMC28666]QRX83106.1 flagellar biosynthesis sigma factor [Glaciimonas sp. PAMC28666]